MLMWTLAAKYLTTDYTHIVIEKQKFKHFSQTKYHINAVYSRNFANCIKYSEKLQIVLFKNSIYIIH